MSRSMTKPTKWNVLPAKTHISLGIRPVWSVFAVRMKTRCVLGAKWRLWTGLAHMWFCGVCHAAAQIPVWLRTNKCMWAATWQNQQSNCAPSKDSDHPPRLIRVFAVRMKKAWVLSYLLRASEDSYQAGRMPRLIWVFVRRTLILFVLSCRGSFVRRISISSRNVSISRS